MPSDELKRARTYWVRLLPFCLLAGFLVSCGKPKSESNDFVHLMNVGKNQYEQGQATNAVASFEKAISLQPNSADAHLNLANALLKANQPQRALQQATETLNLEPQSAAARYVAGLANLRLGQLENAVKNFQECLDLDVKINAVSFQLARAHQDLGHFAEAADLLRSVIQWEPKHPSAHYVLSQVLFRMGQNDEGQKELKEHLALKEAQPAAGFDPERCVYTEARVPFVLEEPATQGVKVSFTDVSANAFGKEAQNYRAPIGVISINGRPENDLLVAEGSAFRLLQNTNGTFQPYGNPIPAMPGARFTRMLVGDLNNDRFEDVVALSEKGIQILKFATNGGITDATAFAGMKNRTGVDGALVDLDLTGKLDLLVVSPTNHQLQLLRNLGPMYFKDITSTSGIPATLTGVTQVVVDDWNGDDLLDVLVAREGLPPLILLKERGGLLVPSNPPPTWPTGKAIAVGDLDNDFHNDLVIAAPDKIEVIYGRTSLQKTLTTEHWQASVVRLIDYDNDGWLDIIAAGDGLRIWRNLGQAGFREATQELGLDKLKLGKIETVSAADFDQDGGTDLLLGLASGGLQLLHNNGGNANQQLKLRLLGTRSNASGLGVRLEITAGNWHTLRTVTELPIAIGLGKNKKPDAVKPHWSDLSVPVTLELEADPKMVWGVTEIELPTGSCPYLYAWDGSQFRFITDILGASPMGLRVSENRFVEADPEEFLDLGNDENFQPKSGDFTVQLTEELREVLYLDEAKLWVVDHPPEIRVCTTSKMLPGRPWIPHELVALQNPHPLRKASNHCGVDVTSALEKMDHQYVSPTKRVPQLRGLAEPSSITLDFGSLPVTQPLVLVMNGWLRFGGGMANVGASHDPELPFPFPKLEVEAGAGREESWQAVDVVVGVPAGKTKTILVDLTGKLPVGSRRLRLSSAFELHWDQIELWERADSKQLHLASFAPSTTDLHWRGFSDFEEHPWNYPLTPKYGQVHQEPYWRITPSGWCTRYGAVGPLLANADNALVTVSGGDELTLRFSADRLPPKQPGYNREYFLHVVGWDKDSDFHVEAGTRVEPFPYLGMADQQYGKEPRPKLGNDGWIPEYNTRWVGPLTLARKKSDAVAR